MTEPGVKSLKAQARAGRSQNGARHPKKSMAYFARESLLRYAADEDPAFPSPIAVMHRVFDVSRSGYHVWVAWAPQANHRMEVAIREASRRSRGSYAPSIRNRSLSNGFEAGVWHIKRLRKKLGISYRQVRLRP